MFAIAAIRDGIIHFNPMSTVKLNSKAYSSKRVQDKKALTKDEIDTYGYL